MMQSLDLFHLQINLEYQLDKDGSILPFPGSSEQAWYLVYKYDQGYETFFNRVLTDEIRMRLRRLELGAAFEHPSWVRKVLEEGGFPCKGEDTFWSGYFSCAPQTDGLWQSMIDEDCWVIVQDGQVVCRAGSIRQNSYCAEVFVETIPGYRRRGYARQVVAAWAQAILESGMESFYSYRMSNEISAALARSLGVKWYADVAAYEQVL